MTSWTRIGSAPKRSKPKPITVAIMGCAVNGPGEAARADYGVAGGRGKGVIFRHGKIVCKNVDEATIIDTLISQIKESD